MNDLFVNVKVDREERPDVDSIYMQAVQAMSGHGGWPMTVFLTPQLEPFWAGTYFPPDDRMGMPSFQRVLRAASEAYQTRRGDVERVAASVREMYAGTERMRTSATGALSAELLDRAARDLLASYDARHGGFGGAPKFPHAMAMEFLLQQWSRMGNDAALEAVRHTFTRMSRGGLYDQLGGGFARYSVDATWLVPHFEKMLYDNGLLLRLGTHLVQAAGGEHAAPELHAVCRRTVDWVMREMTSPEGGFYSTLDADSEGEEGKFYVWSDRELRDLLGADADAVMAYWGVTSGGNFEGHNILSVAGDPATAPASVAMAIPRLLEARSRRLRPARDEKILASWNGLMLRAVAEWARAFGSDADRDLAVANGGFLWARMVSGGDGGDGDYARVSRSYKDGIARINGFLEDYAAIALGMLALYELTFDANWLSRARTLCDSIVRWFWDDDIGAFFDTPSDHERLMTRPRDVTDNATPSGTSLTVELLLKLGDLTADADMRRRATYVLETLAEPMATYPLAFGHALTSADLAVRGAVELAIAGDPSAEDFQQLAHAAAGVYVPTLIVAGGDDGADIALLADRRTRGGRATAYVCRGYVCDEPVTDADALVNQLARVTRSAAHP